MDIVDQLWANAEEMAARIQCGLGSKPEDYLNGMAAKEIERLRSALKECSDDLETSVKAEYRDTLDYPSQKLKFDRDMLPVIKAREVLGAH